MARVPKVAGVSHKSASTNEAGPVSAGLDTRATAPTALNTFSLSPYTYNCSKKLPFTRHSIFAVDGKGYRKTEAFAYKEHGKSRASSRKDTTVPVVLFRNTRVVSG